jgi:hypothetical protein
MAINDAEWWVSTLWAAAPGPDGGFYGSTGAQPASTPETSYQNAAARARAESVLPGVTNSQIFRHDVWYETWSDGEVTDTSRRQR